MVNGSIEQEKQAVQDHRADARLDLFWHDVRFELGQLWKNPGFTLSANAALALGIGANTGALFLREGHNLWGAGDPLDYIRSENYLQISF
jgi:hypothetical protein